MESQKHEAAIKEEELNIIQEIHGDEAYLKFMKNRWGIDFNSGTYVQKAIEGGIDNTHFYEDAVKKDKN